VTLSLLMVALALYIGAEFQAMLAAPLQRRQEQIADPLLPVPVPVDAAEIVSAIALRGDLIHFVAQRRRLGDPA